MQLKKMTILDFNQIFSSLKPAIKKTTLSPTLMILGMLLVLTVGMLLFGFALANPQ